MATPDPLGHGMLLYDHDRTQKIVERLRGAEGLVRFVTVAASTVLFALSGASAGAATQGAGWQVTGGVLGAVVGFGLGNLSMVLVSAVIEWMCQMLIAQGEILEAHKRSRRA